MIRVGKSKDANSEKAMETDGSFPRTMARDERPGRCSRRLAVLYTASRSVFQISRSSFQSERNRFDDLADWDEEDRRRPEHSNSFVRYEISRIDLAGSQLHLWRLRDLSS